MTDYDDIYHHGILGQKWGKRNGPPYPLGGGDYSPSEHKEILKARKNHNSIYNKKHYDEVLKADKTVLTTLSYDPHRTHDVDMFFAAHDPLDKHEYNALFNKPIEVNGQKVRKFKINNKLAKDIKVASEDSAAEIFIKLYNTDRNFHNFVTDPDRMQSYFVDSRYKFKGYREARDALERVRNEQKPSEDDLKTVYRMFNYVIPYGDTNDPRGVKDVVTNRQLFFKESSNKGYGALLDTNDAIYGGFKAKSPVIVFDMESLVPDEVKRTTMTDQALSSLVMIGRKIIHQ